MQKHIVSYSHITDPDATTCNLFDGKPSEFNDQENRLFEHVGDALDDTGIDVKIANVEYDKHGDVAAAEFSLATCFWCRDSYYCAKNRSNIPDRSEVEGISGDWYYAEEKGGF
ncbi:hypothetical protein [Burkholderia pyrrocinia]|uniref:hypothetical protein n=1 Tax=Burkholderia pyrrocinia TaxID=60550 RepID=UPI001BCB9181|nr:hypothetical protein [Burkholderia pyrrocinia]QVN23378.1 hypothetical protein JYG32_33355 [Burkholderia pyrrocinia]